MTEGEELAQQPPLELLNRFCYYRERLRQRHRLHSRPRRSLRLLRPLRLSLTEAYSRPHLLPRHRGELAPFQLQLRRMQVAALRQRDPAGTPPAPLTHYQAFHHRPTVVDPILPLPANRRPLLRSLRGSSPWRSLRRRPPTTDSEW